MSSWRQRVALVWLLLLWGAGGCLRAAEPLEKVTVQLKWKHQFQFAGYYAAIAQGYYRDAGLDVTLREGSPDHDPTEMVLAGKAEFGIGNSDLVLFRYQKMPVVVLAAIFQHSPLGLVVRAASGATDLQGLHDKRLMWIPSESAELRAYFKYEGVDSSKLNVRPHTFNIEDFISGNVDAMSAYLTDEPFLLKLRGVDFLTFVPRAGGIDFYGDCLFTTEKEIREHPARVRAFREASLKGWEYALTHQEEIVDLIMRDYNTQNKSREHYLFEARQTAELMHPGLIEVGHMNPGRWRHIADTYAEFGMMPRDYPLAGFLYNPNPQTDYSWLYWTLGIVSVVAVAAVGWAMPMVKLNRRLRLAKEAAEAADAAKSHYLAVITHEIRTPLSGIIGLTEHLQEEKQSATQGELLSLLQKTGRDMLRLINNVLEYSRLEAGRPEMELSSMDVAPMLNELRRLFSASLGERHLEFQVILAPGTPEVITTDVLRLKRILQNLLSNAIKFTESGKVILSVLARPEPPAYGIKAPQWRWRFVMQDTGLGISPEQAGKLFNPYAQAHSSIAGRYGGTGLGLAISRHIAQLLGGRLVLETSTPGQGSTFVLEIVTREPPVPAGA